MVKKSLVQSLIKETLPSWFLAVHGLRQGGEESRGMVAMLGGYALAYFAVLYGSGLIIASITPAAKDSWGSLRIFCKCTRWKNLSWL